MDSNIQKKHNFILKIIKIVGRIFSGLKCKSKCCNSECLNEDKTIITVPQGQPEEELE